MTYKIALLVASLLGVAFGLPMFIWLGEWVASIFLCLGCCGFLVLPSLFTWRCTVNSISMTEECFILFVRYKKKFLWNDVKYQKFRLGETKSIVFYNQNKKRLISFDGTTVSFNQILKMAKRKSKLAIAVTVVGVCVVLPSLAPAFMSAVAALSAKGKALVSICTAILNGLRYLPA